MLSIFICLLCERMFYITGSGDGDTITRYHYIFYFLLFFQIQIHEDRDSADYADFYWDDWRPIISNAGGWLGLIWRRWWELISSHNLWTRTNQTIIHRRTIRLGSAWLGITQINSSLDDKLRTHEEPFGKTCVKLINS